MKKTAIVFSCLLVFFVTGCATVPSMKQAPASFKEMNESFRGDVGVMWKDAELLLMDVPLNKELVKTILPCGLWPTEPAMGTLVLVNYPVFPYGVPYHEALLMIHVRSILGEGWHCAWILVDSDTALIPGRELLGYPKKMGDFYYTHKKDAISASVTRRGVKLFSVNAKRGGKEERPAPVFARKTFNVGGLGQMYIVSPLILFKVKEDIHESYKATVDLKMNYSKFDPIAEIISGPPVNARMVKMDIVDSDYYFMLWWTGGKNWFLNTFNMRNR
jgi:acetoacetate decarboxylase